MYLEPRDLEALLKYAPSAELWERRSLKVLWAEMVASNHSPQKKTTPDERVARDERYRLRIAELEGEVRNLRTELRQVRGKLRRIERSLGVSVA